MNLALRGMLASAAMVLLSRPALATVEMQVEYEEPTPTPAATTQRKP